MNVKLFARDSVLDLSHPQVMGILNITPDSFSDGGSYNSVIDAIKYTNLMISSGATIIDIGGESTRPGSKEVNLEEELSRVIPILEAISKRFDVWISINTSKPEVMLESARAGAHIINDIRSLTKLGALEAALETNLPICIMHMQGEPKYMQDAPNYDNIIVDVNDFFIKQIKRCERAGILKEKLILDPGFGFGKNLMHNYTLLAHLSKFHHFNLPLLVGMSRKSMIGQLLNVETDKRLNGSLACAVIAAIQGANIIRVHDVKETVEAMHIVKATLLAKRNSQYE